MATGYYTQEELDRLVQAFVISKNNIIIVGYDTDAYQNAYSFSRTLVRAVRNAGVSVQVVVRKDRLYLVKENESTYIHIHRKQPMPENVPVMNLVRDHSEREWITHPKAFWHLITIKDIFDLINEDLAAWGDVKVGAMASYMQYQRIPKEVYSRIIDHARQKVQDFDDYERERMNRHIENYFYKLKSMAHYARSYKMTEGGKTDGNGI